MPESARARKSRVVVLEFLSAPMSDDAVAGGPGRIPEPEQDGSLHWVSFLREIQEPARNDR